MALNCTAAAIPNPSVFGAEILGLQAALVTNLTENIAPGFYSNHGGVSIEGLDFCNVTVTYTHPGRNDSINVQVWLPADGTWNERLQTQGGSGFQAGLHYAGLQAMKAAMGEGYATAGTDAGLGSEVTPVHWGLVSPGNPNLNLLENLGSTSLNETAVISKSVIQSFYGQPPKFSYFNGCSQGGRQGHLLAQRYPEAYDGIAASAPAINWNKFFVSGLYSLFLMDSLNYAPPPCEISAFTTAAIAACDGNDGVLDGIISDADSCSFDPMSLTGTVIDNCTDIGTPLTISAEAATIVAGAWGGAKRADGSQIWSGVNKDATLVGSQTDGAVIPTTCSGGTCVRGTNALSESWVGPFVYKDMTAVFANVSQAEFDRIAQTSFQQYASFLETADADLSVFRDRGGKMLGYHGMIDATIPTHGSQKYYEDVLAQDANAADYYRLFLAPGIAHCFTGPGAFPDTTFDALVKWVEEGVAPNTLAATSVGTDPIIKRTLCPYPQKEKYDGVGNTTLGEGFSCA